MKLATSTGYMFAIILQLSLFSLAIAESLSCYQCSSEDEYTCGEFFDPKFTDVSVTECPLSDAKYCIKTTGIFSGNLGAKRFCSERFLDNYCTYVRRPGDQREYRSCVYTCTGDGCNSSTGLTPTKLIQMSALLLLTATAMTSHRL
ncbi:U-scoloptoxin(05)-Sa1a isoform X1 [Daphnia magna]|uniref:Protein sleepless n=1 Tax=Daphnia magna TaxID=35525 RepID=A0ABQ9YXL5_9CRUS|nr:U-scoloptoxin(05)-Sa1a isoform X1 [Daphnia magna]XP_045033079.1 U-scoloptoxin(05)-Sa1a isoform X1 [Daphnia magna]KAK4004930.1 hypothetical protein OUZ56_006658 [Daphnia magna]